MPLMLAGEKGRFVCPFWRRLSSTEGVVLFTIITQQRLGDRGGARVGEPAVKLIVYMVSPPQG